MSVPNTPVSPAHRRICWKQLGFSIRIPGLIIIHFEGWAFTGFSKYTPFQGLAHYDPQGRCVSKSLRNITGEFNHYSCNNQCISYSRKTSFGKTTHYGSRGKKLAYSHSVLGFLHKSTLRAGFPSDFFQPFFIQESSQPFSIASTRYFESLVSTTSQDSFNASSAEIAAISSILLFVVSASPPDNSFSLPL